MLVNGWGWRLLLSVIWDNQYLFGEWEKRQNKLAEETMTPLNKILLTLGILVVFIASGILFNSWKDRQLVKKAVFIAESDLRFTQLVKTNVILQTQLKEKMQEIAQKQATIDDLENNPTIIIQSNDKIHLDLDRLNAYNSIVLFTNNAPKYDNKRERYSLHRFIKND